MAPKDYLQFGVGTKYNAWKPGEKKIPIRAKGQKWNFYFLIGQNFTMASIEIITNIGTK